MSVEHLFAGIPVRDHGAARGWYVRLFGREPDLVPHESESAWKLTETSWVYVVEDAERAGSALVTILVDDLDSWAGESDESVPGMRRAEILDPDGNRIQIAQPLSGEDGRMAELPAEVRELFEKANYGHLATVMPDGAPHSVAVWTGLEGGRIVFFTQETSRKARNLARDPRIAVSIIDRDNPYRTARVRGRVAATREGDAALEVIDRLAQKFTGKDFPMRSGTVYEIEPEKVEYMELPFEEKPGRPSL